MAKTSFIDEDPINSIAGTVITAAFFNALNKHYHDGLDSDGHGALPYAADTGSEANAYIITLAPALEAYVVGMPIFFRAQRANSGASTLNINALGVKSIVKKASSALEENDILIGQICAVIYDGTNFQLLNPSSYTAPSYKRGTYEQLAALATGSTQWTGYATDRQQSYHYPGDTGVLILIGGKDTTTTDTVELG